jgi:hypothetical protein
MMNDNGPSRVKGETMRTLAWTPIVVLFTVRLTMASGPVSDLFPSHEPIKSKAFNVGRVAAPLPPTPSKITLTGVLSKLNIPGLYQTKAAPGLPVKPASRPQLGLQKLTPANSGLFQPLVPLSPSTPK